MEVQIWSEYGGGASCSSASTTLPSRLDTWFVAGILPVAKRVSPGEARSGVSEDEYEDARGSSLWSDVVRLLVEKVKG